MTEQHIDTNTAANEPTFEAQASLQVFVNKLQSKGIYDPQENPAPTVQEDGSIFLGFTKEEKDFEFTASDDKIILKVLDPNNNSTKTFTYDKDKFAIFTQFANKVEDQLTGVEQAETVSEETEEDQAAE